VQTTGVEGAVLWVSVGEFSGTESLLYPIGPRIKVVVGTKITAEGLQDAVSVRISDPPEVLGHLPGRLRKQVVEFINLNRDTLLGHWRGELDAKEMLDLLQRV